MTQSFSTHSKLDDEMIIEASLGTTGLIVRLGPAFKAPFEMKVITIDYKEALSFLEATADAIRRHNG